MFTKSQIRAARAAEKTAAVAAAAQRETERLARLRAADAAIRADAEQERIRFETALAETLHRPRAELIATWPTLSCNVHAALFPLTAAEELIADAATRNSPEHKMAVAAQHAALHEIATRVDGVLADREMAAREREFDRQNEAL